MTPGRKTGLAIIAIVACAIIFTGLIAIAAAKMSETAAC